MKTSIISQTFDEKPKRHERRGKALRFIAAALAFALAAAPLVFRSPQKVVADSTTDSIRDQIAAAQEEQERLQAEIAALDAEAAQSSENKQLYDQLAATTQNKIYLSTQLLTQYANQIEQTQAEIDSLKLRIDRTMERYLRRVRESYEDGSASYLELILGSESIADFLSRIDRINALLEYDRDLMKGYEEDVAALEKKKTDLGEMQSAEEEARTGLEADQSYYDQLSAAEASRYQSLLEDEAALQERYAEAAAAEAALGAELEAYIAEWQRKQQEQSSISYEVSGDFIRPIAYSDAYYNYVSCWFGEPDPNGTPHRGTDIACPEGTPIMAAASGTVLKAEWHWSWGNYVLIDHGNGITTLYAHCSALFVAPGQVVMQGETIGLVGNTGFSFGAHVHVEVTVGGTLVDGAAYIPF